jgi:hypothetical protein
MDVVEGTLRLSAEDLDRGAAEMPERASQRLRLRLYGVGTLLFGLIVGAVSGGPFAVRALWIALGLGLLVYAQLKRPNQGTSQIAAMSDEEREVSYRFDADGVRITTPVTDVSLRYAALQRQVEGQSAFLLYVKRRVAQIIPKRAFDQAQLERIRGWLRLSVPARRRPKLPRVALLGVVLVVLCLVVWQWLAPGAR